MRLRRVLQHSATVRRRRYTPSGMPASAPTRPDTPTINSVSQAEVANSSSSAGVKLSNMGHFLHEHAGAAQMRDGAAIFSRAPRANTASEPNGRP